MHHTVHASSDITVTNIGENAFRVWLSERVAVSDKPLVLALPSVYYAQGLCILCTRLVPGQCLS